MIYDKSIMLPGSMYYQPLSFIYNISIINKNIYGTKQILKTVTTTSGLSVVSVTM
jgi:hypothetical protein